MNPVIIFEIVLIGASILTFGVFEVRTVLCRRRAG